MGAARGGDGRHRASTTCCRRCGCGAGRTRRRRRRRCQRSGDAGPRAAAAAVHALVERGETLAVAESLTGGLLAATIVEVAGVSAVFRGGLVVYATDLKARLAGVPADAAGRPRAGRPGRGARARGRARRERCGADWGLATTGVAGPGAAGRQAGRAGLRGGRRAGRPRRCGELELDGGRAAVRDGRGDRAPCGCWPSGCARRPRRRFAGLTGRRVTASRGQTDVRAPGPPDFGGAGCRRGRAAGTVAGSLRRCAGGRRRRRRCEWSCYAG